MYLRSTCGDEEAQVACAAPAGAGGKAQLNADVTAGTNYYLFVDGAAATAGPYTLSVKLTSGSLCGDGAVSAGEVCDDGNNTDGDGCAADCRSLSGSPAAADCSTPHDVHLWRRGTLTSIATTVGRSTNSF